MARATTDIPTRPPFVCPALVLAAGAFCGIIFFAGTSATEYILAGAAAACTILFCRRNRNDFLAFLTSAALFALWTWALAPHSAPEDIRKISGLCSSVSTTPAMQRAVVETKDFGLLRLNVTDINPELSPGDIVEFTGEITPPDKYRDVPFMRMVGMSNRADRISGEVTVTTHDLSVIGRDSSFYYRVADFRRDFCDAIYALPVSPEASQTLAAVICGERRIDPAIRDSFRLSGLAHLLCVSGFHVGLIAAFILFLLSPLRRIKPWFPSRYLIVAGAVWVYAFFVGLGPSTVRAATMITVFAAAAVFQRIHLPLNTLCVAFAVVLALNPYRLFSAGFQMSFAAVLGIILFATKLNPVPRRRPIPHRLIAAVTVPAAAMLGTLPVTLAWFNHIALLTIPANVLATALFPVFIISGVIAMALSSVGLPCGFLFQTTDLLYRLLRRVSDTAVNLSEHWNSDVFPATGEIIAIILAMACLTALLHLKKHRLYSGAALALCLVAASGCSDTPKPSRIFVHGTSKGCEAIVATGKTAHVYSRSELSPPGARFCAAAGYEIEKHSPCTAIGDILLVEKGGDAEITPATKHVLLSASLREKDRRKWIKRCSDSSVPFTDLRRRAFYLETK